MRGKAGIIFTCRGEAAKTKESLYKYTYIKDDAATITKINKSIKFQMSSNVN
jgi:hypothetical protein